MTDSTEPRRKTIALVAHDNMKDDLFEWAKWNRELLSRYSLVATGTTGKLLAQLLNMDVTRLQSGPLGGDQQLGAMIAEGRVDYLVFFWDPLNAQPHDPDVKALLRLVVVWNIPCACNRATADFIFSSALIDSEYERRYPDYEEYRNRKVSIELD